MNTGRPAGNRDGVQREGEGRLRRRQRRVHNFIEAMPHMPSILGPLEGSATDLCAGRAWAGTVGGLAVLD